MRDEVTEGDCAGGKESQASPRATPTYKNSAAGEAGREQAECREELGRGQEHGRPPEEVHRV